MSINQVMNYGTDGMSEAQKQDERERRLNVVTHINKIGAELECAEGKRKDTLRRRLNCIKADENVWLKEAAWFLYL